ncbi:MAG: helix-turn-helix domain-containing protein [Erysipelotrichaceae bacterium]
MKEQNKYEIIKELVDHKGNKRTAALKLGISVRHVNRLIKLYKNEGKDGFYHHNRNRQPVNSFPIELSNTILNLYKTKHQDFNYSHFRYMLQTRENISVSYSYIYRLLTKNECYSLSAPPLSLNPLAKQGIKPYH